MKRWIAWIAAACLVLLGCVPALAAETATITISGEEECRPGSTITLTFGVEAGSNMAAVNFEVTYDTDAFEYLSYEDGSLSKNAMAVGNLQDGVFKYAYVSLDEITQGGDLFTVTFAVDSDAAGQHLFYFYTTSCARVDFTDIATNTPSFTLTVAGEPVSDVHVKPVMVEDKDGNTHALQADNGANATGVQVDPAAPPKSADTAGGSANTWLVVGLGVALVAAVVLFVMWAVNKAKKGDAPASYETILDEDAYRSLPDRETDALEDARSDDSEDGDD